MEPWVHTDKSKMSSVGAALTARAFALWCCGLWLCVLVVVFVEEVPPRWGSSTTTAKAMSVRRTYFRGVSVGA